MFRRWFVRMHGEGALHQADVYRCYNCGRLVTWKKIRSGTVCCMNRVVPGVPTWFETVRLFLLPWSI